MYKRYQRVTPLENVFVYLFISINISKLSNELMNVQIVFIYFNKKNKGKKINFNIL